MLVNPQIGPRPSTGTISPTPIDAGVFDGSFQSALEQVQSADCDDAQPGRSNKKDTGRSANGIEEQDPDNALPSDVGNNGLDSVVLALIDLARARVRDATAASAQICETDDNLGISPTPQPQDAESRRSITAERSTIVSAVVTPPDEPISQATVPVASDADHVQTEELFSTELVSDLLPVDKAEGDAIQKEIGAHGAKPKAHVLDNASAVEKAPNSNVASTTTCADLNAVSDDKTPSVDVSADRTLSSPADASAAGSTNTLVAVEAIKAKSEVCCEMNATPTVRPRPTENRSSGRGENLPIANPDSRRQMSLVVPSERDTGEERMVGHGPDGDGKPAKFEVSDTANPTRRKEPTEASDEIPSRSSDVASIKSGGLASTEVIASTPFSRSSSPMQTNAETQSDVSTVSRHAAPLQHAVAEAQHFEGWQNARMLDRAGQAEMKLGVETAAFGSVRIHTVVRDSQVGLTISGERGNLSPLIAAEMPGVEARLREQDLRINTVRVYETAIGSSTSGGSQGDTRERPTPVIPSRGLATASLSDPAFDSLTMMLSEINPGRVNIRV